MNKTHFIKFYLPIFMLFFGSFGECKDISLEAGGFISLGPIGKIPTSKSEDLKKIGRHIRKNTSPITWELGGNFRPFQNQKILITTSGLFRVAHKKEKVKTEEFDDLIDFNYLEPGGSYFVKDLEISTYALRFGISYDIYKSYHLNWFLGLSLSAHSRSSQITILEEDPIWDTGVRLQSNIKGVSFSLEGGAEYKISSHLSFVLRLPIWINLYRKMHGEAHFENENPLILHIFPKIGSREDDKKKDPVFVTPSLHLRYRF